MHTRLFVDNAFSHQTHDTPAVVSNKSCTPEIMLCIRVRRLYRVGLTQLSHFKGVHICALVCAGLYFMFVCCCCVCFFHLYLMPAYKHWLHTEMFDYTVRKVMPHWAGLILIQVKCVWSEWTFLNKSNLWHLQKNVITVVLTKINANRL